jgi:hypothetical protein
MRMLNQVTKTFAIFKHAKSSIGNNCLNFIHVMKELRTSQKEK